MASTRAIPRRSRYARLKAVIRQPWATPPYRALPPRCWVNSSGCRTLAGGVLRTNRNATPAAVAHFSPLRADA